jgi:hypothetical protein
MRSEEMTKDPCREAFEKAYVKKHMGVCAYTSANLPVDRKAEEWFGEGYHSRDAEVAELVMALENIRDIETDDFGVYVSISDDLSCEALARHKDLSHEK